MLTSGNVLCRVCVFLTLARLLPAQEPAGAPPAPPVAAAPAENKAEGTLQLGDKTFQLKYVLAYESEFNEESVTNVLLSDRPLPVAQIRAALTKSKGSDSALDLRQPHLKLVLKDDGKVRSFVAIGGGTTIASHGRDIENTLKIEDGRIRGTAKLPLEGKGTLQRTFEVSCDVAIGLDGKPRPKSKPAGPVKPEVTGSFVGNDVAAKLKFVSARRGQPFADQPGITLIFTEQDHLKDPKADINAGLGKYGNALVISLHEDGNIYGCEVAHKAHSKTPFSSSGNIRTGEFELVEGQISGALTTDGEQTFFDETWNVDLKFVAPFEGGPTEVAANDPKMPGKSGKPTKPATGDDDGEDGDDEPTEPSEAPAAGESLSVYQLALPQDAKNMNYKKVVQHLEFTGAQSVSEMAQALKKSLAEQGWESQGADLVTPATAILRRKRDKAELTIFVKPGAPGSKVTMMTKGLDWEKKPAEKDAE